MPGRTVNRVHDVCAVAYLVIGLANILQKYMVPFKEIQLLGNLRHPNSNIERSVAPRHPISVATGTRVDVYDRTTSTTSRQNSESTVEDWVHGTVV